MVRNRSILVVLGEGGVGKTTVAAAMSALAAASGRRVLAVTVDPANRLKDSLGLSGRPGVEEPVSLAAFGPVAEGGSLHAMVLEAATELDRLVGRLAPSDDVRRRVTDNVFYRKAAATMAGTHEYVAMERLLEALDSGRYDLIVLDTPPERHALDFLDAPDRLNGLLGSDVFQLFVQASSGLGRLGLGAIRFRKVVLRGIGRFAGEQTFLALLDFVLAFAPMFDGFRERSGRVRAWLSGDQSATVIVGRPEPGTGERAREAAQALRGRGILPTAFVMNRVHAWPPRGCRAADAPMDEADLRAFLEQEPSLSLYDRAGLAELATEASALAKHYHAIAADDGAHIAAVGDAVKPAPVHVVPLLRDEVRDLAGLSRFADVLKSS